MISRRKFLTGSAMAGLFGSSCAFSSTAKSANTTPWYNWSGELSCVPAGRVVPKNEAALVNYIQSTTGALRPVGSGHSFSPLVPTDGHIIVMTSYVACWVMTKKAVTPHLVPVRCWRI